MNLNRHGSVAGAGPEVQRESGFSSSPYCFRIVGTGVNVHGNSCATLQGKNWGRRGEQRSLGSSSPSTLQEGTCAPTVLLSETLFHFGDTRVRNVFQAAGSLLLPCLLSGLHVAPQGGTAALASTLRPSPRLIPLIFGALALAVNVWFTWKVSSQETRLYSVAGGRLVFSSGFMASS